MRNSLRGFLLGWLAVSMMLVGLPAQARMIGTESMLSAESRTDHLLKVESFMARDDVQAQLQAWGVPADQAAERVARLSDTELQQLAQHIDAQPAGGDVLAVIGIVFVVLLILELVGVTNIFSRI